MSTGSGLQAEPTPRPLSALERYRRLVSLYHIVHSQGHAEVEANSSSAQVGPDISVACNACPVATIPLVYTFRLREDCTATGLFVLFHWSMFFAFWS